jgi:hypothetical protein
MVDKKEIHLIHVSMESPVLTFQSNLHMLVKYQLVLLTLGSLHAQQTDCQTASTSWTEMNGASNTFNGDCCSGDKRFVCTGSKITAIDFSSSNLSGIPSLIKAPSRRP